MMLSLVLATPALGQPPLESSTQSEAHLTRNRGLARQPAARARKRPRRRKLDLVQLTSGPGFRVLNPHRAWGQPLIVWRLNESLRAYQVRYPEAAPLLVQDLSKRGGGRLEPHQSHRSGWDVDVGVVRRGRSFDRLVPAGPRTLDVERTWWLIHSLIETGDVQYVFLNKRLIRPLYRHARRQGISKQQLLELFHYPRRDRWGRGIIRAEPGHTAHFHVRFLRKRPPQPVS